MEPDWVGYVDDTDQKNNYVLKYGHRLTQMAHCISIHDALTNFAIHMTTNNNYLTVNKAIFLIGFNVNETQAQFDEHANVMVVDINQGVAGEAWLFEPHKYYVSLHHAPVPRIRYTATALADALGVTTINRFNGLQTNMPNCSSHCFNAIERMITPQPNPNNQPMVPDFPDASIVTDVFTTNQPMPMGNRVM